jgi:hypothetical protein
MAACWSYMIKVREAAAGTLLIQQLKEQERLHSDASLALGEIRPLPHFLSISTAA